MRGLAENAKQRINDIAKSIAYELKTSFGQSLMRQIGNEAARLIYVRTKLGYGNKDNGGTKFKFKQLNPFYVEIRRAVKSGNRKRIIRMYQESGIPVPNPLPTSLDDTTKPAKSNLTFSGQLLRSIKVKSTANGNVIVAPVGYRNDGLTNEQVANSVTKFGRPFMKLTKLEENKLKRFAKNGFESIFKERIKRIKKSFK